MIMLFKIIKNLFFKSVEEPDNSEAKEIEPQVCPHIQSRSIYNSEAKETEPQVRPHVQSRIASIYNSVSNFKTALATYSTINAAYDPYQKDQHAFESGFDPYCDVPSYYLLEQEENVLDTYHDAQDYFFNETLPATKRIRVMAASAIDSAAHSIALGAMGVVHYLYNSVPLTASSFTANSATPATRTYKTAKNTAGFSHNMNSDKETIEKKKTVSMRGFGVDFTAIFERSHEMGKRMETVGKQIRVLYLEDNEATQQEADRRKIVSGDGDQRTSLKPSIDDTWGFVERDSSIKFKSTVPPPKPPRGVYVNPLKYNAK